MGFLYGDDGDRNGNIVSRKGGTVRVKAEEIDTVIGEFIYPLCFVMH